MFAKVRRHRDSTSSPSTSAAPTPVSPLAQDFDFGLSSPVSASSSDPFRPSADSVRSRHADRPANRKSIVSLQPPVLPPIPRVASANRHDRREKATSQHQPGQEMRGKARESERSVDTEGTSRQSALGEGWDFNPSFDWQDNYSADTSGASSAQDQSRKSSNHAPSQSLLDLNFDSPRMEASMFPRQEVQSPATTAAASPAMSRSFVDSRDKPYSQPAQRPPPIQSSYSSPDMLSPGSPATFQSNASGRSPLSPYSATSGGARLSPHTANSPNDLRRPASGVASTSYSGSTARPSTQSSTSTAASPLQHQTIGTPYQETSPSFPAPQHVATRPKTIGSSSTIAGVMVPTHHTSGQQHERPKSERRKTRLLNPMALLQRRRSGQDTAPVPDEEELRLRAQAQARQKRVATIGVNPMPEDFDPRIRGKVVHDFSAPRPQRNYSYSDAERRPSEQLQSFNSAPFISPPPDDSEPSQSTQHSQQPSNPSSRHSRHAPVFVEHLAEDPDPSRPMSSVQAETLENREFLNRASHHSAFGQDSSTLPPFARRSQQMDPMQASFFRDDESNRSSDPSSSSNERSSGGSSGGFVSPLIVRQHNAVPDPWMSSSPVSPQNPDKGQRPVSDMSAFTQVGSGPQNVSPVPDLRTQREENDVRQAPQPVVRSPEGQAPSSPQQQTAQPESSTSPSRMSREAPGTLSLPKYDTPANPSPLSSPRFDSSTASTPEAATFGTAVAVRSSLNASPPKIVEKRASAVGHSKRVSNIPKHRVSNASRFSFQMGESAAEERVLEEKHRRMAAAQPRKADVPDEDDEDYFDEDAMDDEDEMEVMERSQPGLTSSFGMVGQGAGGYLQPPTRERGQDSDDGSVYDDEVPEIQTGRNGDYAMHPAFRGVEYNSRDAEASGQQNMQGGSGLQQFMDETNERHHQRYFSDASVLSSNPGDFAQPRGGFYMQPQAAGYSAHATPIENPQGASTGFIGRNEPLNSSEKNRTQQPRDDFGSPTSNNSGGTAPSRDSASTTQSTASGPRESRTAATTVSPEPVKDGPMGLGVSGFSDFVFTDGPDLSLGNSPATSPQNLSRPATAGNRSTADSTTLPQNGKWMALSDPSPAPQPAQRGQWDDLPRSPGFSHAGPGSQGAGLAPFGGSMADQNAQYAAPSASNYSESDYGAQDAEDDDMYFDDGGFDAPADHGPRLDEDELDRPDFAGGFRGMEPRPTAQHHQRDPSAMTITSLSSDGPYPSFAIPNQLKQRQRDSRLLLEDLPLQTNVDPRWIPQRNPSEDAKRLGLSSRVPPLPAQPGGGFEALERMQASLQGYHAALADAAMKAAGEGRFMRQASLSTVGSGSPDLARGGDERSVYSQEGGHGLGLQDEGEGDKESKQGVQRAVPEQPPAPQHGAGADMSSPSKLAFDFGFNDPNGRSSIDDYASNDDYPTYDYPDDSYDATDGYINDAYSDFPNDDLQDDDVIAAANAEALANDDDGFYGTEFGFYAKARPSISSQNFQSESINGGYFGDAGEDPFALRNKALQEPNLTPITERSEFSTRNSMIHFGPPSAGPWSGGGLVSPGLARLPISPLAEGDGGMALEQLRKARAGAFGGSNPGSPGVQRFSGGGYFGAFPVPGAGGTPGQYSADGLGSRDSPASARGAQHPPWMESAPTSASSNGKGMPFSTQQGGGEADATPRKAAPAPSQEPETVRKVSATDSSAGARKGHEREGSDSVAYVQERDPSSPERPRWVLERRRTGELGTEVVGREVVRGGWI